MFVVVVSKKNQSISIILEFRTHTQTHTKMGVWVCVKKKKVELEVEGGFLGADRSVCCACVRMEWMSTQMSLLSISAFNGIT